jgi:hypothetical protein
MNCGNTHPNSMRHKMLGTKTTGNFSPLPSGAIVAFKDFKVSVPNEVIEKLLTLLRISPIAEATYESTRPNISSE